MSRSNFASNACAALGTGFAVATAATLPYRRLRNANGAAALVCGIAALAFKLSASRESEPVPHNEPLATEPSDPAIDFSIIVPVYNRAKFLVQLMDDLAAQAPILSRWGNGEIVIADDGSTDDTVSEAERLAASMPIPARVLRLPHQKTARTRNAAFAAARGRIGISIDSDCRPKDNWLPGLLAEVADGQNAAAFARVDFDRRPAYPIENIPDPKGFVTASFAIDRERFCRLGGFYTGFGVAHEDLDLVQYLESAGVRIVRAEAFIEHPIRYETPASIWRLGLNSRFANLLLRRHGLRASGVTRTTPYYFFGIAGNYVSSVVIIVASLNVGAALLFAATSAPFRTEEASGVARRGAAFAALYITALAMLGVRVGAGVKRLPMYVTTLGAFQIATCLGRLRGSLEYGIPLL